MIKLFVDQFNKNKSVLRDLFSKSYVESYSTIVKNTIQIIAMDEDAFEYDERPSVERIHEIDDGSYQGTLLFVIGAEGYQPDNYWYVKVGYGSCSGCDTLEALHSHKEYDDEYEELPPLPETIDGYMTLALHIVQGLKSMQIGEGYLE